jgi:hypothetical protein
LLPPLSGKLEFHLFSFGFGSLIARVIRIPFRAWDIPTKPGRLF